MSNQMSETFTQDAPFDPGPALVEQETNNGVTVLTLNRPDARNALSNAMLDELLTAISAYGANAATRVIVIAAAGSAFCAGHDLRELTMVRRRGDDPRGFYTEVFGKSSAVMLAIQRCPKPVIAEVNGMATAAGCQLVAACDLAVASKDAKFATPGVNIGLFCSTPMVALTRAVPRKQAMEMLLTGEPIDAERAEALGLINQVVPPRKLRKATLELAEKIAARSLVAVGLGKQAFYDQLEAPTKEAYIQTARVMVENMLSEDAEEGIGAFIGKKTPRWRDR